MEGPWFQDYRLMVAFMVRFKQVKNILSIYIFIFFFYHIMIKRYKIWPTKRNSSTRAIILRLETMKQILLRHLTFRNKIKFITEVGRENVPVLQHGRIQCVVSHNTGYSHKLFYLLLRGRKTGRGIVSQQVAPGHRYQQTPGTVIEIGIFCEAETHES